ncbi:MAG: cell surface protein [Lachnospiraceae bacterium]|nr:cell surface protein [Lachnospiraceae bacterium]
MKTTRRILLFMLIAAVLFFWKLNTWSDDYGSVEKFRGAHLEETVFYPLIATSINDGLLASVTVNGLPYAQDEGEVYVDEHLKVNVSTHFIRDVFECSARVYDGDRIEIDRGSDKVVMRVGNTTYSINGYGNELNEAPTKHGSEVYIPLDDLCGMFGYAYQWDTNSYTVALGYDDSKKVRLPRRYDLREAERTTKVRDQGDASTCWAYASIEALESAIRPEMDILLSADDMINNKPYEFKEVDGGDYTMALSYLLSGRGPVGERGEQFTGRLREVHFYEQDDIDDIKWSVYRYGGVTTSIYVNVLGADVGKSAYYDEETNSYCYNGSEAPNHDVVIIGWDDDYDSENFPVSIGGDGAFICQNSWGDSFGEDGVFYVSYYDTNIGGQAVSYVRVDETDDTEHIYQSDLCGWTGQIGYQKEDVTAANVFTADGDQIVTAAGFYALDRNTSYEIFFVENYTGVKSLAQRKKVGEGVVADAGYYTVAFEEPKEIREGSRFAVVIHLKTPGAEHPMAIEYQSERIEDGYVDITDGEGFVSRNGLDWDDVEDMASGNLCLKAYASEKQ